MGAQVRGAHYKGMCVYSAIVVEVEHMAQNMWSVHGSFGSGHGLDLLIILITYLFPFQPTRIGVSRPGLPGHHDRTSTGMGRLAPAASVVRFYQPAEVREAIGFLVPV